jgi:hypothetical protein
MCEGCAIGVQNHKQQESGHQNERQALVVGLDGGSLIGVRNGPLREVCSPGLQGNGDRVTTSVTCFMDDILGSIFRNQWFVLGIVGAVLLALAELGFRAGTRLHLTRDEARKAQIGGVQGAVLGLLALLLGFTFAMAVNRYETRRDLVLKEANAIGTTWLRAGLLPEVHRMPVRDLLRRYVDVRLNYEALSSDPAMLAEGIRLSAEIETELWKHAEAAAEQAPTPIVASFIAALNETIDTDAERLAAARNRIPGGVWLLLIVVASFGCFTSSYGSGANGARSGFTSTLLPLLIAVVIALIFDLMHPHQGFINVSQRPLLDLKASFFAPT